MKITQGLHLTVAAELKEFGGVLRCTTCGLEYPLGDIGDKLKDGWPKHCGYTMRWVTQSQIDAGLVNG